MPISFWFWSLHIVFSPEWGEGVERRRAHGVVRRLNVFSPEWGEGVETKNPRTPPKRPPGVFSPRVGGGG